MKINNFLSTIVLTTVSVSSIVYTSFLSLALAAPTEIKISNISEQLAPSRLLRGDREFDGHGPAVKSNVRLRIGDGGQSLYADIYIHAKETKRDWSETEGRWTRKVWQAPRGQRITKIVSDNFSETSFISKAAGFEILGSGADFKKFAGSILDALTIITGNSAEVILGLARTGVAAVPDGTDHIHIVTASGDDRTELVKLFAIVGDTGGADISDDDNPKNDTRIVAIEFNPVRVELASASPSTTSQTETNVVVRMTTGSDDLRGGNNAFISLNLVNGSRFEVPLGGGFSKNSVVERRVTFTSREPISLNQIRSITIRHDGSPRSGHPFDNYDEWDLQKISVSLADGRNIYNSVNDRARSRFVQRFNGQTRQIVLPRQ